MMLTCNNDVKAEIKKMPASGNRCLQDLNIVVKARYTPKKRKLK
jgi:hypothetical protein